MGHLLGCRNLIKAFHWNGIFVTGLDFYYTHAIQLVLSPLKKKITPFSQIIQILLPSFKVHLKPHFLPETPFRIDRIVLTSQNCTSSSGALQHSFTVSCLIASHITIELPKIYYERNVSWGPTLHFYYARHSSIICKPLKPLPKVCINITIFQMRK